MAGLQWSCQLNIASAAIYVGFLEEVEEEEVERSSNDHLITSGVDY